MSEEKKTRKPRKPKAEPAEQSQIPMIVRQFTLDPATRERLTTVGWLQKDEPMINVETVREVDLNLEVLTFESGRRLITVSPLYS